MKYTYIIYALAFSAVLLSCSGQSITDRLDNAEKIMRERPDSALSILSDIDWNSIPGKRLKARYALLYSMVLDK
ncbi:MAG: tetratricopeptide repeat protein, partial [Bacteroidales bacterium]|nr:tetratricopeptide repeat protein [Bacteroidales bacterium]